MRMCSHSRWLCAAASADGVGRSVMGIVEGKQVTRVLDETVVLVTGGARPLGASAVRAFHAAGARICIHYNRSSSQAMALASELEDARAHSVRLVRGNLRSQRVVRDVVMDCIRGWGRLDVLVNTSSMRRPTVLSEVSDTDISELLNVNYLAPLYLAQSAERFLSQHQGAILNMLDMPDSSALAGHCVYAPATAALLTLTRVLAMDMAPDVRVNALVTDLARCPKVPVPLAEDTGVHDHAGAEVADGSVSDTAVHGQSDTSQAPCVSALSHIADKAVALCFQDAAPVTGQIIDMDVEC